MRTGKSEVKEQFIALNIPNGLINETYLLKCNFCNRHKPLCSQNKNIFNEFLIKTYDM